MTDEETRTGLKIIAMLKLVSAILLALAGLGIFYILTNSSGENVENVILLLNLNPNNSYSDMFIHLLNENYKYLGKIEIGTFFYSALYLIEGIGLFKAKLWAEYMTVIITASLLPIEIYEIILKADWLRIGAFTVNLIIVVYLTYVLLRGRKKKVSA